MTKLDFIVQPQKSDGRGWVPCEVHKATGFAVLRVETFKKRGRKFTACRVLARFQTKAKAEDLAQANKKSHEPLARCLVRKLGQRVVSSKESSRTPSATGAA